MTTIYDLAKKNWHFEVNNLSGRQWQWLRQ